MTPTGAPSAPREVVLALEAGRKRKTREGLLRLSTMGVVIDYEGPLLQPLRLGIGAISVGCVEPGSARARSGEGRFPILRRLGPNSVVPRSEGIEGWLWTSNGGSGMTMLVDEDEAPNAALVFAKPLGEDLIVRTFEPEFVTALAARSPLGVPAINGLLFRVADTLATERAFTRFNLERPLTDREIPPTLRRSLPTDRSADPMIRLGGDERVAESSVAPPGLG
jgi:hypothetical protein